MSTEHDSRVTDERLTIIEEKLDKLSKDVEDLVSAWKAAAVVVALVKWAGSVAAAITAILALVKIKG